MLSNARKRQNAHDALLWWCSEVGSGSGSAFLDACAHLTLDPWRACAALSALGHIEFDWRAGRFATAPTVITTIPGIGGRLLVCGARPTGMMEHLRRVAEDAQSEVDVSEEPCHQFGEGPSTVLIDADPHHAQAFAAAADVAFVPAAHDRIARLLDRIDVDSLGVSEQPDERFPHAPIDARTFQVRWDWDWDPGRAGLWRYRTFDDPRATYLRRDGTCLRLVAAEYGPYLMTRPDDADPPISYSSATRVLAVDGHAPMPALHARAATLCSGRVALRQHFAPGIFEDHYVNVDEHTAGRLLRSLRLDWEDAP